jgi:hypothetical protein
VVKLKTIDFAIFPRLEWSDRYLDMMMQTNKQLPRKVIVAGTVTRDASDFDYES